MMSYDGQINGTDEAAVILTHPENAFGKPEALRAFLCTNADLSVEYILNLYTKRWPVEVFFRTTKGKTCSGQISVPFRNRNTSVLASDVAHPLPVLCGQRGTALFFRGLRILTKACSAQRCAVCL